MKFDFDGLPMLFAGSMTGVTALFGGWDVAFQVFVICLVADMATGVLKGFVQKDFSSKRMREGFVTKFGYIIVIVLATQFDRLLLPEEAPVLRTIAVFFYIFVEGSSVLENLAQMGVPIPQAIVDRLSVLKGKNGAATLGSDGKFVSRETELTTKTSETIITYEDSGGNGDAKG